MGTLPACALVEVAGLAFFKILVEIEGIAHLGASVAYRNKADRCGFPGQTAMGANVAEHRTLDILDASIRPCSRSGRALAARAALMGPSTLRLLLVIGHRHRKSDQDCRVSTGTHASTKPS